MLEFHRYRFLSPSRSVIRYEFPVCQSPHDSTINGDFLIRRAARDRSDRAVIKQLTGLSGSTIYKYVSEDRFPKAARFGERSVAWRGEDILAWQQSRAEWRTSVGPDRLRS